MPPTVKTSVDEMSSSSILKDLYFALKNCELTLPSGDPITGLMDATIGIPTRILQKERFDALESTESQLLMIYEEIETNINDIDPADIDDLFATVTRVSNRVEDARLEYAKDLKHEEEQKDIKHRFAVRLEDLKNLIDERVGFVEDPQAHEEPPEEPEPEPTEDLPDESPEDSCSDEEPMEAGGVDHPNNDSSISRISSGSPNFLWIIALLLLIAYFVHTCDFDRQTKKESTAAIAPVTKSPVQKPIEETPPVVQEPEPQKSEPSRVIVPKRRAVRARPNCEEIPYMFKADVGCPLNGKSFVNASTKKTHAKTKSKKQKITKHKKKKRDQPVIIIDGKIQHVNKVRL